MERREEFYSLITLLNYFIKGVVSKEASIEYSQNDLVYIILSMNNCRVWEITEPLSSESFISKFYLRHCSYRVNYEKMDIYIIGVITWVTLGLLSKTIKLLLTKYNIGWKLGPPPVL